MHFLSLVFTYPPADIADYFFHSQRRKMLIGQIPVKPLLHVGLRFGQAQAVDATLARLLGRPWRTFRYYARDYRELWL